MTYKYHLVIFISCLVILLLGRAQQVTDSRFTILLSHSFYSQFSNNLKPFLDFSSLTKLVDELTHKIDDNGNVISSGQIIIDKSNSPDQKWRMKYSPMPSILSIPLVIILDNLGLSVVDADTSKWQPTNEIRQQVIIASILCALYAAILFNLAKLWLPQKIALLTTMVLVLGGSVISTLSRALWSDTWGCLLVLLAIHHLAYAHLTKSKLNAPYLLILVSLAVFCKPLFVFSAFAVAIWIVVIDRKKLFVVNILAIIASSIYFTWALLTNNSLIGVYHIGNFNFFNIEYFAGILISPSRVILIFSPWVFFLVAVLFYTFPHINKLDKTLLVILSLPIIGLIMLLSAYELWWAGFAYGPRLQSSMMPWLSLLAIIIVANFSNLITEKPKPSSLDKGLISMGVISSTLAIIINVYGINQTKAFFDWHLNIDYNPLVHQSADDAILERMWNWQDPIFLAGIVGKKRYYRPPAYFQQKHSQ